MNKRYLWIFVFVLVIALAVVLFFQLAGTGNVAGEAAGLSFSDEQVVAQETSVEDTSPELVAEDGADALLVQDPEDTRSVVGENGMIVIGDTGDTQSVVGENGMIVPSDTGSTPGVVDESNLASSAESGKFPAQIVDSDEDGVEDSVDSCVTSPSLFTRSGFVTQRGCYLGDTNENGCFDEAELRLMFDAIDLTCEYLDETYDVAGRSGLSGDGCVDIIDKSVFVSLYSGGCT